MSKGSSLMRDQLTVLSHSTKNLAKTWLTDGTIKAYDLAKQFTMREEQVGNVHELSALLARLNNTPRSCIIRGKRIDGGAGKVYRRLDSFADQPLHTVLIEVDSFVPLMADPLLDPVEASLEFVQECLPAPFHGASFHWQLSNSAGHPTKRDVLKVHLWFWLETPATSAQLRKWAIDDGIACDKAVFNPVQVHYTAAPLFDEGVVDPVRVRSGFHQGARDSVAIEMPEVVEGERRVRLRGVVGERANDDPVAAALYDNGMVLDDHTAGVLHITCPFDAEHSPGSAVSSTSYFLRDTGGYEQGHFKCLHDSCTGRCDEDFLSALGLGAENDFDVVELSESKELVAPGFKRSGKSNEHIVADRNNLILALSRPDVCKWDIRFDTFRDEVMYTPVGKTQWRSFSDEDYFYLSAYLESQTFKPISTQLIREAVYAVAKLRQFDSAQAWLNGIPAWDGVSRVEGFPHRYLGAEDSEYTRAVSRYIWTALAGRVLVPGCKADMVPVLIGKQGVGKSRSISEISPAREYFEEIDLMERDADLSRRLRGKLVVEISELRGLQTRDIENIKAFISRTHESWIPKYKEFSQNFPRRCVFIGTTNQKEFLADKTGNRRWLPIECLKADVDSIKSDRLQLWAEAKYMFTASGVLWEQAEALSTDAHEPHTMTDTWREIIETWLDTINSLDDSTPRTRNNLQISEILRDAFHMEPKNIERRHEKRVVEILREMGFDTKRERINGKQMRVWSKNVTL